MANDVLTGLTATFASADRHERQAAQFMVGEAFRERDSEGFEDLGFQTGKITGQGLSGRVVGWIRGSTPGMGTIFENVACTATAASGRTFPMNVNITNINWGAKVGELQTFEASFKSTGAYTSGL